MVQITGQHARIAALSMLTASNRDYPRSTDVAGIGRLASGAGRCRGTAPSLTLGPLPCRSKPRHPAAAEAVPALAKALKDQDEDIRQYAADALGRIGPAALPVLCRDPDLADGNAAGSPAGADPDPRRLTVKAVFLACGGAGEIRGLPLLPKLRPHSLPRKSQKRPTSPELVEAPNSATFGP